MPRHDFPCHAASIDRAPTPVFNLARDATGRVIGTSPMSALYEISPHTVREPVRLAADMSVAPSAARGGDRLALGLVGNGSASALIDRHATMVWSCAPRLDSDPVFLALLDHGAEARGEFAVDLHGASRYEQRYDTNTAVLRTKVWNETGDGIEITDFAPRFIAQGRVFRPPMLVRRVRVLCGTPSVRIRLRPCFDWGRNAPQLSVGNHHVRYSAAGSVLRVTTDAPLTYLVQESFFILRQRVDLVFGEDESLRGSVADVAADYERQTLDHWRHWSRHLAVPLQWQDAVIRAAITLKLCVHEDTGAIVAAMTTSIPEAPSSGRNWDYRYCWLRDAYFVVRALNSLSEVGTMENYLEWLWNVIADAQDGALQPLYGVGRERRLDEAAVPSLSGYLGMAPVRRGNQAYEHAQHDVWGSVVLGAAQAFFDRRLLQPAAHLEFAQLERIGEQAVAAHQVADAGLWELRTRRAVHTHSVAMCWAACDRLAKIAVHLGLRDRARYWRVHATRMRAWLLPRAWNERRQAFVDALGSETIDASVLLLPQIGLVDARDPRFVRTYEALERTLCDGAHVRRYEAADDFGVPCVAFNACSFWRVETLCMMGRRREARALFEDLLSACNPLGLMAEDTDPDTGMAWGNFPQTLAMAALINAAVRLSSQWRSVL